MPSISSAHKKLIKILCDPEEALKKKYLGLSKKDYIKKVSKEIGEDESETKKALNKMIRRGVVSNVWMLVDPKKMGKQEEQVFKSVAMKTIEEFKNALSEKEDAKIIKIKLV